MIDRQSSDRQWLEDIQTAEHIEAFRRKERLSNWMFAILLSSAMWVVIIATIMWVL